MDFRPDETAHPGLLFEPEAPTDLGYLKPLTDLPADAAKTDAVARLAEMVLQRLADGGGTRDQQTPRISGQFVDAFCRMLVLGREREALNMTRMMTMRGADFATIVEQLFAAAARRLGERWQADEASMAEVNIGISTLSRTFVALRSANRLPEGEIKGTALFASLEGQSHTLGLTFAAEYFRQRHWHVTYLAGATEDELVSTVVSGCPDVVGLSAASREGAARLGAVIARLRALPASPRIIVGGRASGLGSVGADAVTTKLDMGILECGRSLA